MEVQSHGNDYEDFVIKRLTGKSKKEYDSLKGKGGYTSAMDLVEGLLVDKNYSIKTAKGNKVDCGDILRRMSEKSYTVVVGQWSWQNLTTSEKRNAVLEKVQNIRKEYID